MSKSIAVPAPVGEHGSDGMRVAASPVARVEPANRAGSRADVSRLQFDEEMVRLHQQIEALLPGNSRRAIQFIGSRDGEGTTSVAREFAMTAATRFGRRVLLLECPQHRSRQVAGIEAPPVPVAGTTLCVGDLPQALVAPSHPDNSNSADDVWRRLRQAYDLIVIDTPPASNAPEGLALAGQVDGVVLVLEAESTRWPVAAHAKESIVRSGGRVLGVVLNKRRHYIPAFIYDWL